MHTDDRVPGSDPLLERVRASLNREQSQVRRRDRHPERPGDHRGHHGNHELEESTPFAIKRDPEIPEKILRDQAEEREEFDDTPAAEMLRPQRSGWKRVLLVGMVLFALVVGYYFVSLWQVWSAGRSDQSRQVDAIVVMGAAQYDGTPSPQLAARLDHVVELWPRGLAPIVVVTGGKLPGDRFTEAQASANYLIERGVPESAIVMENQGATTFESLERVAVMLNARLGGSASAGVSTGIDTDDAAASVAEPSVLVVTDPYHTLRSRLTAQEVGLTSYVSPTNSSVVTGARSFERHIWEAGGVSIGRLTSFEWLTSITD